ASRPVVQCKGSMTGETSAMWACGPRGGSGLENGSSDRENGRCWGRREDQSGYARTTKLRLEKIGAGWTLARSASSRTAHGMSTSGMCGKGQMSGLGPMTTGEEKAAPANAL